MNRVLVDRIVSMPGPLAVIFLASLLSPLFTVVSVLDGTIVHNDFSSMRYGAAESAIELALVLVFTIPPFVGSILLWMRIKLSRHVIGIGSLLVCLSHFFLSGLRSDMDFAVSAVLSRFVVGLVVYGYLLFSSSVKEYFDGRAGLEHQE